MEEIIMREKFDKYKITSFVFWIISVYAIFLSIYCVLLNNATSITQLLFIFALACFIYMDVVLVMEYIKVNKLLRQIKGVETKYKYFQTYVDESNLIIETLKEEVESLKKDLSDLKIESKEISEDEKFVKYIVDLKQ